MGCFQAFLALLSHSFYRIIKRSSHSFFPFRVILACGGAWASSGVTDPSLYLSLSTKSHPEEPKAGSWSWNTYLTPSTPGRTWYHNDRLEERKEKHQLQQKMKVLCLPCASWDCLCWQISDHHPDQELVPGRLLRKDI